MKILASLWEKRPATNVNLQGVNRWLCAWLIFFYSFQSNQMCMWIKMFSNVKTSAFVFFMKSEQTADHPGLPPSGKSVIWKMSEDYSLILSCAIASVEIRLLLLRNWGHSVLRVRLHSVHCLPVSRFSPQTSNKRSLVNRNNLASHWLQAARQ